MSIGAKDRIDKLLVKKYASMKVDNPGLSSMVDPDKIMTAMNDYSSVSRSFMLLHQKLKDACRGINEANASYYKKGYVS